MFSPKLLQGVVSMAPSQGVLRFVFSTLAVSRVRNGFEDFKCIPYLGIGTSRKSLNFSHILRW